MEKILIIEDNEMMRLFLANYFSSTHEVVTTESATSFPDSLDHFSLIITDYHPKNTSGRASFIDLQRRAQWIGIPMIVLTDQDKSQERIDALEIGANDCLSKPFNPIELSRRVNGILHTINPAVYRPVA